VSEGPGRAKKSAEPKPRASRPAPRSAGSWVSLAVACAVIAFVAYVSVWLVTPHAGRRGAVRIAVSDHAKADEVALALYRAGTIDRPWLFS
jgi:hypothetical protein